MLSLVSVVAVLSLGSDYDDSRAALEATRVTLAAKKPHDLKVARAALEHWLVATAFPAWTGTPWDFNGMSEVPGQGKIACGYFVSTLLLHAGVKVQRIRLAQQSSERIVKSLASTVEDFAGDRDVAVQHALARGNGLYVVGMDFHVGFLRVHDGAVDFCNSSYVDTVAVICEPAATSGAFGSRRYVLGDALSDRVVTAWLDGTAVPTRLK